MKNIRYSRIMSYETLYETSTTFRVKKAYLHKLLELSILFISGTCVSELWEGKHVVFNNCEYKSV